MKKQLTEAIESSNHVKSQTTSPNEGTEDRPSNNYYPNATKLSSAEKERVLREELRKELLSLYKEAKLNTTIPQSILQSQPYKALQSLIIENKKLEFEDSLWHELKDMILENSPKFLDNLNLLTSGNLTAIDIHTALLIKCGIKPSQMMGLLDRSNGAIVSRRESLCYKVFDKKMGTKIIDAIIRSL